MCFYEKEGQLLEQKIGFVLSLNNFKKFAGFHLGELVDSGPNNVVQHKDLSDKAGLFKRGTNQVVLDLFGRNTFNSNLVVI